ncbi:MAG: hypothetical protein QOJ02_1898 [Acidobacteriota bacterium]|jgi:hypothetical protein|nr:hypothetical protein [Acidobacteriota bacterium]
MMNDEPKSSCLPFIIHRSAFIIQHFSVSLWLNFQMSYSAREGGEV